MSAVPPDDAPHLAGRRGKARLRTQMAGELLLPYGRSQCLVLDLSQTGAQLELPDPPRAGADAILYWNGFELFGTVRWAGERQCGVSFDDTLAHDTVLKARDLYRSSPPSEREQSLEWARRFVLGHRA